MKRINQLGASRAQLAIIVIVSLTFGTATALVFPLLPPREMARVNVSLTDPPFGDSGGYPWDNFGLGGYPWENFSWQDYTWNDWSDHWRENYGPSAWENYRPYTWENYEWYPSLGENEYPQIFGCTVYKIEVTLKIELHKDDCTWHTIIDTTSDMVALMRAAENRFVDVPTGHYDRVRITVSKVEIEIEVPGTRTITVTEGGTFEMEMEIDLTITSGREYDLRFDFDARASIRGMNPMTGALSWQTSARSVWREYGGGWRSRSGHGG